MGVRMMDLIDRAEVQYKMLNIMPEADSLEWYESAKPDEVKDLVDELYSIVLNVNRIDAQPVKHGRFVELPKALNPNETPCQCSNCKHVVSFYGGYPKSKFCGECGAKMDGDADET